MKRKVAQMSSPLWRYAEQDREFFCRELASFVPDKVYDAHVHLGPRNLYGPAHAEVVANTPEVVDMESYRSDMAQLLPDRQLVGASVIPSGMTTESIEEGNHFAAVQAASDVRSGTCILVHPNTTVDKLRQDIQKYQAVALKPYHLMTQTRPTLFAKLQEYVPDQIAQVADETSLPVIVHLVRPSALADESNQKAICRLCKQYPRMKLILAHAARGFNPAHTVRGIEGVKGLDNLYFDASSVAEGGAIEAILRAYGSSRLMWGSDYPFSHLHGRCVAINDSFTWLYDDQGIPGCSLDPDLDFVFVGLESLRVLKHACVFCGLSDSEVEAVFLGNALTMFLSD